MIDYLKNAVANFGSKKFAIAIMGVISILYIFETVSSMTPGVGRQDMVELGCASALAISITVGLSNLGIGYADRGRKSPE